MFKRAFLNLALRYYLTSLSHLEVRYTHQFIHAHARAHTHARTHALIFSKNTTDKHVLPPTGRSAKANQKP